MLHTDHTYADYIRPFSPAHATHLLPDLFARNAFKIILHIYALFKSIFIMLSTNSLFTNVGILTVLRYMIEHTPSMHRGWRGDSRNHE